MPVCRSVELVQPFLMQIHSLLDHTNLSFNPENNYIFKSMVIKPQRWTIIKSNGMVNVYFQATVEYDGFSMVLTPFDLYIETLHAVIENIVNFNDLRKPSTSSIVFKTPLKFPMVFKRPLKFPMVFKGNVKKKLL